MTRLCLFTLCLFTLCCAPVPLLTPRDPVVESMDVTVALVWPRVCGGVWVADDWILTANHCTELTDEYGIPVGEVGVVKWAASPAQYDLEPRLGRVVYQDSVNDLALLHAKTWPVHRYASVAALPPAVGSAVHVVGHPDGLSWTYLVGTVAQNRPDLKAFDADRPFLQLQVPISGGNSGGGAFDDAGQLVGIADMILTTLPGQGFFVPVQVIRPFLKRSHVQ